MLGDLLRAFVEAVVVRGLPVPPDARVVDLRVYPDGSLAYDYEVP